MYKVMGLDIGTKRIGVALSDYLLITANGFGCVERTPDAAAQIQKIAKENNVKKIVVGLPLNMDGTRGEQARDCMDFASQIDGFEVLYEDERLTSEAAEENLRARGVDFRKDKSLVDIESACVILEQYLLRAT
jgi:putative Holliday junction resolvase